VPLREGQAGVVSRRVNYQFDGTGVWLRGQVLGANDTGPVAMLGFDLLQGALSALSTMFGSLGVFSVYMSFLKPALAVHAVVFLAAAMAILRSSPQK
jgi:hypothetical protein